MLLHVHIKFAMWNWNHLLFLNRPSVYSCHVPVVFIDLSLYRVVSPMIFCMYLLWFSVCISYGFLYVSPMIFCMYLLWFSVCISYGFLYASPMVLYIYLLWFYVCISYGFLYLSPMVLYIYLLWFCIFISHDFAYISPMVLRIYLLWFCIFISYAFVYLSSMILLRTKLYDKWDDFNFPIVNFPLICSSIPAVPTYGVYVYIYIFVCILFRNYPFTTGANISGVPMFVSNNHK